MSGAHQMEPARAVGVASPPLWRNRDYLLWFGGDLVGDLGTYLRAFAMPLITYAATGSLTDAGVVGTASALSGVLATLPGGVVVDRCDRKRLLVVGHLVRALVFLLACLAWWTGNLTLWVLLAVGIASGSCSGIFGLASSAMLKHVVPDDRLPSATAADQARNSVLDIVSQPLGGLLLGLSPVAPFIAETIAHLAAAGTTRLVRADTTPAGPARQAARTCSPLMEDSPGADSSSPVADVVEGWLWLRGEPFVLALALVGALGSFAASGISTALILDWSRQGVPAVTIGSLTAVAGVTMLLGATAAPWITQRVRGGRVVLVAGALSTAGALLFTVATGLAGRTAVLVLYMMAVPVLNAVTSGYVVHRIPSHVFGRVAAAVMLINAGPPALAPWVAGHGLDVVGARATFAVFALAQVVALVVMTGLKDLRRLGLPHQW